MTTTENINFEELRKIIQESQEKEVESKIHTKLIDDKYNIRRNKIKKLNPKFCIEWIELEKDLKVNRLIEYVERFKEKEDLTDATCKKLRKLLVDALVNETLDVDYDSSIGIINKIHKLQYNDIDGFYLGTYLNEEGNLTFKISKISKFMLDDNTILTEDFKSVNKTLKDNPPTKTVKNTKNSTTKSIKDPIKESTKDSTKDFITDSTNVIKKDSIDSNKKLTLIRK